MHNSGQSRPLRCAVQRSLHVEPAAGRLGLRTLGCPLRRCLLAALGKLVASTRDKVVLLGPRPRLGVRHRRNFLQCALVDVRSILARLVSLHDRRDRALLILTETLDAAPVIRALLVADAPVALEGLSATADRADIAAIATELALALPAQDQLSLVRAWTLAREAHAWHEEAKQPHHDLERRAS